MRTARDTLLLDACYQPIDVIGWKEAVRLLFLGKIEVLQEYERNLRSAYLVIKMPAVARLINTFKVCKKKIKFSRLSVYTRDKFKCQYCGMAGSMDDFTFDHVVPRARGGKTAWDNIVTCCPECNGKKGDKSIKQAGMKLLSRPTCPEWLPIVKISISQEHMPQAWREYLIWSGLIEG